MLWARVAVLPRGAAGMSRAVAPWLLGALRLLGV